MYLCVYQLVYSRSFVVCESERAVEAELQQSKPLIYDQMMVELEKRTKGTAAKCRSVECENYGNSRCGGFCHECYSRHQMARHF